MKKFKKIKPWLFMVAALALLFLAGCEFVALEREVEEEDLPEIGVTSIDADLFPPSDEWLTVPLEELPFQVQIPSWWAFFEVPPQYSLNFDEGLSGSIVFLKKLKDGDWEHERDAEVLVDSEGLDVLCYEMSCAVEMDGEDGFYSVLISNKTFTATQLEEAYEILRTIKLDSAR